MYTYLNYVHLVFLLEEYNDEHGNPIWKNRVESWKDKKSKKSKAPAKAKLETQIPPEQHMEENQ